MKPASTEPLARASVERYRLLFEGNASPMWVFDTGTLAFLEVNEAAVKLYGYTRRDFLSMSISDIRGQEDLPRLLAALPDMSRAAYTGSGRHRKKDGSPLIVDITANPIEWEGRPACFVVARDVTLQRRVEVALRESEERFHLVSLATNDVVWDWDLVTDKVWWNEGIGGALGYQASQVEFSSDWWKDRIHPDERESVYSSISRILEKGDNQWTGEYRFRRADGTYVNIHDRGYVLRGPDGKPVRMIGAMMDVTERRKAEAALRESQELTRQMAEAIQDVFYVSDASTNEIIFMNAAFDRLWGMSRKELQAKPRSWLDRVHPDDCDRVVKSLGEWKPQAMDPEWNEEFRIIRPDGAVRWIWVRSFPIRNGAGEIVRFAGVERDVTERKRSEETVHSLLAISRHLNATLDVGKLMQALVQETLRLLDAEGGCAGLLTPRGMTCQTYCTRAKVIPFHYRWPPGHGLPGWVTENRAPYVTNDAASDKVIDLQIRRRFKVRSTICMPLLDPRGEPLGFILIHNKRDSKGFDRFDEEKLSAVSRAASVAVQNALAYHKLQETAEALRCAEEKYRGIFENAVEGIGRTTPEGRILAANPALARMLGYASPEELIASVKDIGRIYVDQGVRSEMTRMMAREKEGAVKGIEVQVRRKDGVPIWLLMNLRAVRDDRGRIVYYDGMVQDVSARRRTEEALREVSGRLLKSQNEERRRIARELHDSTAQSLAALGINLSMVGKEAAGLSGKARKRLLDSIELTLQCCREVRTLSYLLHPPALEEGDLWSAVRWYTEGFATRSGIRVDLKLPKTRQAGRLPEEIETTLFRIVQESLANIHRHSGSRRARIRIARGPARVTLVVRDQGRGLRKSAGRRAGDPALLGVGIAGMRERVRQLGGTIDIASSIRGTAVKVLLPLRRDN